MILSNFASSNRALGACTWAAGKLLNPLNVEHFLLLSMIKTRKG